MDTQKLKYFIAVAESLSFSEAAVNVGISQSAISQQIAELEKQAGAQLINRTKRPFQLTSAGRVLLEEARSLVAKSDEALKKTKLAAEGMIGYLKVGFLGGIERHFLPQGIREFRQAYPNIELSLQHYNWGELNKALTEEIIDVGFTMTYGFDDFPQLVAKNLYTDLWGVAMHCKHPLASESKIDVARLKNESFVTFYKQTDYLLHNLTILICAEHGFIPNIVSQFWDLDSILFMVESGLAVAIVPGPVREVAGRAVRIIEIGSPLRYFDALLAWKISNINPAIPVFVEKLVNLDVLKASRAGASAIKQRGKKN